MTRRLEPALLPFMLLLLILPFPGTVALRLLCLAAAFAYAVYAWKRLAVPPLPLKGVLGVWVLVVLASLFYSVDPAYSLGEIKNELGYTMMAFVAFFVVTTSEERLKAMLLALAAGAVGLCVSALAARFFLDEWDDVSRHGGTASFATYLAAAVPAIMFLGLYFEKARLQKLSLALIGLLLVTGIFSQQRIIWPVLLIQACAAIVLYGRAVGIRVSRLAGVLAIVSAAILLALAFTQFNRFKSRDIVQFDLIERDRVVQHAAPSAKMQNDDRLVFWPKVVRKIAERPFIGAGFGRRAMSKAYPELIPSENPLLWHAHNLVLNYGISMGIPGMLVILLLFGALGWQYLKFCRASNRRLKLLGVCGIALVLGVFARNMVNDLFLRDGALLFWALNGSFLGLGLRLMAAEPAREADAHA